MTTRVIYRVDAHSYDVHAGACRAACAACAHEGLLYRSAEEAWAAQPAAEAARVVNGDPRFEIVALEHF
jgi:hypothetical protein